MGTDKAKTRTARGGAVLPGASGRASRARVREAESGDSRARDAGTRNTRARNAGARDAGGDSREAAGSRAGDARARNAPAHDAGVRNARADEATAKQPAESGGPAGLEPTRYGDWEKGGRCSDF